MALPIIFFHYGNPAYLKYSLKQAKHFNPGSTIYLLGDGSNNHYPFIQHSMMDKYEADTQIFTSVYQHQSVNGKNYELQCFLRWFYIEAFCREHHIGPFIYLDSDVLLFQQVSEMEPFFGNCSIANTGDVAGVPAFTYFGGYHAIKDFCDYMVSVYTQPELLRELEHFHRQPPAGQHGDISDMILFQLYFCNHPAKTKKLDLMNDELAVDENISHSDGYETQGGIKKIYWQNGLPYCRHLKLNKLVRFASFHYQGDTKGLMINHYKGGGYVLSRFWDSFRIKFKRARKTAKKLFK